MKGSRPSNPRRNRKVGSAPILPVDGWAAAVCFLTIGAMTLIAVVAAHVAYGVGVQSSARQAALANTATVYLPAEASDAAIKSVLEMLAATPGVEATRLLGPQDQAALLAPWLGDDINFESLPVPHLIDITLGARTIDTVALQTRLKTTASGAAIDDHSLLRSALVRSARSIAILASGVFAISAATAIIVIMFVARARVREHSPVAATLRSLGAEHRFVAKCFASGLARATAAGAIAGAIAASAIVFLLPLPSAIFLEHAKGTPTPPERVVILLLVLLIMLGAGLGMLRLTLRRELGRLRCR